MATIITYTTTSTQRTVKPTQTLFTNNTGWPVTLQYANGGSLPLSNGATATVSNKISAITMGAQVYYSALGNDYQIPANTPATLTVQGSNIEMTIG